MAIRLDIEKLKARAEITGDFMDQTHKILRARFDDLQAKYATSPRSKTAEEMAVSHRYLFDTGKMRSGEEYLLLMLQKQSGIAKYGTMVHNGEVYIRALTHNIIAHRTSSSSKPYSDLGRYEIIAKVSNLSRGSCGAEQIHLIPVRDPHTLGRHYHHVAYGSESGHPLDLRPSTCINSFGAMNTRLARVGDIPGFIGSWYIFLTRFNAGSPLRSRLSFERRL